VFVCIRGNERYISCNEGEVGAVVEIFRRGAFPIGEKSPLRLTDGDLAVKFDAEVIVRSLRIKSAP